MTTYSKYIDTKVNGLGEIPDHWKLLIIKRIVKTHKQGYYNNDGYLANGTKLLRITDIDDNANVNYSNCPHISISEKESREFCLNINDFVFARSGTIGRFGVIKEENDVVFASYLIKFTFSTDIETDFLKYYFLSHYFKQSLLSSLHGGANQNIHAENIKYQYLTLPPKREQILIIRYLNERIEKIDSLIEKKQKLIEFLKEERTAIIGQAVIHGIDSDVEMKDSGVKWIGEIPKHWEVKRIKYLISFSNGYAYSSNDWVEIGIPVIRMSNISLDGYLNIKKDNTKYITKELANITSQYILNKGDLLIAMTDMSSNMGILGRTIIFDINDECYLNQRVGRIKIESPNINREYFFYVTNTDNYRNQIKETVYPNVQYNASTQSILNARIPIPPIEEQLNIVEYIKNETYLVDLATTRIQREIDLLQEYRTALISEVVTGKIDVREEVVSWI